MEQASRAYLKSLIITAASLVGIAVVLSVLLLIFPVSKIKQVKTNLLQVDQLIAEEKYEEANTLLVRTSRLAEGRQLWDTLLKRAYIISNESDNFEYFFILSKDAVREMSGFEEFWAYYIFGASRTGRHELAIKALDNLESEEFQSIKAEALLNFELMNSGIQNMQDESSLEMLMKVRNDPYFYSYLGDMTSNDIFYFDAALLAALTGDWDNVSGNIGKISSLNNISPLYCGLLMYDSGKYMESVDFFSIIETDLIINLNQDFNRNQLIGDSYFKLYMNTNNMDYLKPALDNYISAQNAPDGDIPHWTLYKNLSLLYYLNGDNKQAFYTILDGLDQYPDNQMLAVFFVVNFSNDYPVLSERVINDFLEADPHNPLINLVNIRYGKTNEPQRNLLTQLWLLFDNNPSSVDIARYLCWYLKDTGDYENITIVINRFINSGGDSNLLNDYIEYVSLLNGYVSEQDVFEDDWIGYYNLSIKSIMEGNLDKAADAIRISERNLIAAAYTTDQKALALSKIKTISAKIAYLQDKPEISENEVMEAIRLNNHNYEAMELYRKLTTF